VGRRGTGRGIGVVEDRLQEKNVIVRDGLGRGGGGKRWPVGDLFLLVNPGVQPRKPRDKPSLKELNGTYLMR